MEDIKRDEFLAAQQAALFEYAAALMQMNSVGGVPNLAAAAAAAGGLGVGVIKPHPVVPSVLFPGAYHPVPIPVQYSLPLADFETDRGGGGGGGGGSSEGKRTLPPISVLAPPQRVRDEPLDTSSCSSGDALNV